MNTSFVIIHDRSRFWGITVSILFAFLVFGLPDTGNAQQIALSFDDGFNPRTKPDAASWNASLIQALSDAHVTSIMFISGSLVDCPEGLELVREWGNAGNAVANHTYSHPNLCSEKVTAGQFTADLEKNEAFLKDMPGWTKRMRFPYLKEGETASKRDDVRRWLADHGYRSGAVSVDTGDWYYNARWLEWRKNHPDDDVTPFRTAYLNHLWNRTAHYDSLSVEVLHRSVSHVILLHANAINAAFLPDIITMYRSKGWTIISPEEAFEDPVYAMNPETLPAGDSILWGLAKERGAAGLRDLPKDEVYEKALLDALGL